MLELKYLLFHQLIIQNSIPAISSYINYWEYIISENDIDDEDIDNINQEIIDFIMTNEGKKRLGFGDEFPYLVTIKIHNSMEFRLEIKLKDIVYISDQWYPLSLNYLIIEIIEGKKATNNI